MNYQNTNQCFRIPFIFDIIYIIKKGFKYYTSPKQQLTFNAKFAYF